MSFWKLMSILLFALPNLKSSILENFRFGSNISQPSILYSHKGASESVLRGLTIINKSDAIKLYGRLALPHKTSRDFSFLFGNLTYMSEEQFISKIMPLKFELSDEDYNNLRKNSDFMLYKWDEPCSNHSLRIVYHLLSDNQQRLNCETAGKRLRLWLSEDYSKLERELKNGMCVQEIEMHPVRKKTTITSKQKTLLSRSLKAYIHLKLSRLYKKLPRSLQRIDLILAQEAFRNKFSCEINAKIKGQQNRICAKETKNSLKLAIDAVLSQLKEHIRRVKGRIYKRYRSKRSKMNIK